ncbi:hypothetical protein [Gottfriedia acidiceleris]|uniref:hypothetical protein n=1 Tax=Gottfriedia acidiceleris TaxID=371036 RepID=UPI003000D9C8
MENNSTYYDSSVPVYEVPLETGKPKEQTSDELDEEKHKITDEMRKNISGNPYIFD